MPRFTFVFAAALIACVSQVAIAQDGARRHNQKGGVNLAPEPGTYVVQSIDSYGQTVQVKAGDGSTASVYVGSDIYDISKLKPGEKIQINFLEPDGLGSNKLKAANIWKVK